MSTISLQAMVQSEQSMSQYFLPCLAWVACTLSSHTEATVSYGRQNEDGLYLILVLTVGHTSKY